MLHGLQSLRLCYGESIESSINIVERLQRANMCDG